MKSWVNPEFFNNIRAPKRSSMPVCKGVPGVWRFVYNGFQLRVQERGAFGVRRVLILLANSKMSDKLMVVEN